MKNKIILNMESDTTSKNFGFSRKLNAYSMQRCDPFTTAKNFNSLCTIREGDWIEMPEAALDATAFQNWES